MLESGSELVNAAAYLELHIEQGPVLEGLGLPLGVVQGTFGWSATASTSAARPPTPAPPPWTAAATPSWQRRA